MRKSRKSQHFDQYTKMEIGKNVITTDVTYKVLTSLIKIRLERQKKF